MKLAVIGSWDFEKIKGGITVCSLDCKSGKVEPIKSYFPHVNVGSTPVHDGNGTIYFVDETTHANKHTYGGGGYVYAAKIDFETGELRLLNYKKSLGTNPCYCALTPSGKYLLVAHHTSSKNTVTKLIRREDGTIQNEILYDDTSVVLFKLNENGSIDRAVDFYIHEREGNRHSLLHSIYERNGYFLSSDKGLDKIYSYHVDEQNGKIELVDSLQVGKFTACRYMAMHPTLNRIYGTNEKKPYLHVYEMDEQGKLVKAGEEYIFEDLEYAKSNAKFQTDCMVSKCGKYLYVALAAFSGEDRIVTMDLDENGIPRYRGYDVLEGICPKALEISGDGKYLYVCNTVSDSIAIYVILADGSIEFKESMSIENAANMRIL